MELKLLVFYISLLLVFKEVSDGTSAQGIGCRPFGQRYIFAFMGCMGLMIAYLERTCINVTLVEIAKPQVKVTRLETEPDGTIARCPPAFNISSSKSQSEFTWPVALQGEILASFYCGYLILQIPGGMITDFYGGKHIFGASVVLTAVCCGLTPLAARYDPYMLMAVRFVMGVVQGPMFPAMTSLLSKWSPREDRAFMTAIANSGVPLGLFICNFTTGYLLDSGIPWDWIFYIFACVGCVWYLIWLIYIFPSPIKHRYITAEEKTYIIRTIVYESKEKRGRIPWSGMCTSYKVLVLVMAGFGFDWGFHMVSIELPFYLSHVLRLPTLKAGVLSGIPWICMWWGSILFGYLSGKLVKQRIFKVLDMRKIMEFICCPVPAVILVIASYCRCSFVLASVLFSVAMFYAGAVSSAHRLSVIELSPNFAGILMSLVNCFGSITGVLIPLFVHTYVRDDGTLKQWTTCFWVASVIMFLFSLPYIICARTNIQRWNVGKVPNMKITYI